MTTYLLTILSKQPSTNPPAVVLVETRTVMAPVETQTSPSVLPAGVVFSHILLTGFLSTVVARTLYRSYLTLPPSSGTRRRQPLRSGYVQTFFVLAIGSLLTALYFGIQFSSLSYRVWALERGVELPDSLFGDKGALRSGEHPGRLHIARWLNDTTFYRDAFEIVAEKARHFWWGQQVGMGLISWSLFLEIEGRKRKIPNLWAFMALGQLVNLSYAQNLFFVAVLLTPLPLPENVKELTRSSVPITSSRYSQFMERFIPAKPEGWFPKPAIHIILLTLTYANVFLIPFTSNTPTFVNLIILSQILLFLPISLPYILPLSWGTIHTQPHATYQTYVIIFRTITAASLLLHGKSTFLALLYNTPESHFYRHSLLQPFKEEHRSILNRGYVAASRLLGAIHDHPAVGAVGWDVILSGLSLGIWAAIRGLEPKKMFEVTVPFITSAETEVQEEEAIKVEHEETVPRIEQPPSTRRRGRPKLSGTSTSEPAEDAITAPKRRGRPPKKAPVDDKDADDASYQPTEGEQLEEGDEDVEDEDWEVGALAWGLISVGGLGSGAASVYGAEIVAR